MISKPKTRIAVLGAGLIGQKHIEHVAGEAELVAIVDPDPAAKALSERYSTKWAASLSDLLSTDRPDGVIIATPTPMHGEIAMQCIANGIPALIEKPITADVKEAQTLVGAARDAGVPLLVGHHRRYNPIIRKAKELIEAGCLGRIVSINALFWIYKPDEYYEVSWRRQKGAGPILTNLIHDIDLMRYLCGDVFNVQAQETAATRGHEVEDSAVILLGFANGALGTMTVSDTIVAPWSWELTAGENAAYPHTNQSCYMIGGSRGSLSLPDLGLWHYGDSQGWFEPISRDSLISEHHDPLVQQIRHFCDVIAGTTEPHVSGHEGMESLRVLDAIKEAATTGSRIHLANQALNRDRA